MIPIRHALINACCFPLFSMTIGACRIKRRNVHGYVARLPIAGKFLRGDPCSILLSNDMKNFWRINLPITWFELKSSSMKIACANCHRCLWCTWFYSRCRSAPWWHRTRVAHGGLAAAGKPLVPVITLSVTSMLKG